MKTAIFGISGSGKTELFLALAGPEARGLKRAMVKVPEPRLRPLADIFHPQRVTPAEIEYLDIQGGGARSLGNKMLNDIRASDCLLAVIDAFSGTQDPLIQENNIEGDLIIADLAVVEKRLERLASDKKKDKKLVDPVEEELLEEARGILEQEQALREREHLARAQQMRGFQFLSAKPILYVWNVSEEDLQGRELPGDTKQKKHVAICAKLERELREIEDEGEREELLKEMGLSRPALETIISITYNLLGYITFLTAGEKEVRAWTIRRGSTAREAAGAIHSDIEKGFIRAEVLSWRDFEEVGGDFKRAKERGLLRLEGKDYVVRDGDIITFRFNI